MAGNSANAALWQNADVYIAAAGTAGPSNVTSAWGSGWTAIGLLDGESGFTMSREDEQNDYYAWGGLLIKTIKGKHKRTITFTALEDNAAVFGLVNAGSTRTTSGGVTTSTVVVPTDSEFAIGFEMRDGDKVLRRIVKKAAVDSVADISENETSMVMYEITVAILPESDGTLFTEISGTTGS